MIKIGVIGTRGFPEIQGGLETHCMELYTRLAGLGDNKITVYRRKPYISSKNKDVSYPNIRFLDLSVPKSKNLETFLHSLFAAFHALFQRYDIVHFHNTGPGFFIPILRLSGAKVVFTYHNVSYTQKKWGRFARLYLEFTERICLKKAHFVIFISEVLKSEMIRKYAIRDWRVISNGVNLNPRSENSEYIESLGLERNKYIIGVGRFLEEKGFDYLIRAFVNAGLQGYKLVIVGDTDYPTEYSNKLRTFARENGVVLTGFIKGYQLQQIYSFARLFVIPSFSEGHPIALLEAMSYNVEVLASDIPANLQIKLEKDDYFRTGDEEDLKVRLVSKLTFAGKKDYSGFLTEKYSWDKIAEETDIIYNKLKFRNET